MKCSKVKYQTLSGLINLFTDRIKISLKVSLERTKSGYRNEIRAEKQGVRQRKKKNVTEEKAITDRQYRQSAQRKKYITATGSSCPKSYHQQQIY